MADNSYAVGGPPGFFGPQNATDQQAAQVIAGTLEAIGDAAEFMTSGVTKAQRAGNRRAPEPPRGPLPALPPAQVQMPPMWLADP